MPLTISHPALVIPLRRKLVLSALVIGSMTPDFSKIFSLSPRATLGHSFGGVFWFCLPVGSLTLLVFHGVLKRPLFMLLPESHQARLLPWLGQFQLRTRAQWKAVIISLILAALSHLALDSFTHSHGWCVEQFDFFQVEVFHLGRHSWRLYDLLQHGSTFAGVAILAWYYVRFYQIAPVHSLQRIPKISLKVKLGLAFFAMTAAVFCAVLLALIETRWHGHLQWIARRAAVASMGIFMVEVVIFSIVCQFGWKHFFGNGLKKEGNFGH